jgi:hypothetical protein
MKLFKILLAINILLVLVTAGMLATYTPSMELMLLITLLVMSACLVIVFFQIVLGILSKERKLAVYYFIFSLIYFCVYFGLLVWFTYLNK